MGLVGIVHHLLMPYLKQYIDSLNSADIGRKLTKTTKMWLSLMIFQ